MELKNKIINFCEKEYLVVDQFEHESEQYIYLINTDAEETLKVELTYLQKCENGQYKEVVEQEKIDKLMVVQNDRRMKDRFCVNN